MLDETVGHLVHNVLAAAADYESAEQKLTESFNADKTPQAWETAARRAKRRAAELAVAIDGLTDRCAAALGISKSTVRQDIAARCFWPGSSHLRVGAHDRVRGVANAYKHQNLSDASLPITSESDILAVGLGWGLDGRGVGKYGGVEVLVRERDGSMHKFLGDVPVAIAAWFKYLVAKGGTLPAGPFCVCGLQVHP